jgi:hypothetical protein
MVLRPWKALGQKSVVGWGRGLNPGEDAAGDGARAGPIRCRADLRHPRLHNDPWAALFLNLRGAGL